MGDVVIDLAAIDRRLAVNGDSIELLLRIGGDLAQAMSTVSVATEKANEAVSAVWAQSVEPSPDGPVIFLDYLGTAEQNRAWLEVLSDHLDGWSGTASVAPRSGVLEPRILQAAPKPAAFLAFRMIEEPPPVTVGQWGPPRWAVAADTTAALTTYLGAWAGTPSQLAMGLTRLDYSDPDIVDHLTWAAEHDHSAGIAHAETTSLRRADLEPWGRVICQVADDTSDWRARVDELREPLVRFGAELDVAFVRHSAHWMSYWSLLAGADPPLPLVSSAKVNRHRRLLDRYVPDAHGIQVLTDKHLARLGPLLGWEVTPLGAGNHLVEARDLAPWFSAGEGPTPDPHVLAAAREDLAPIILSPEAIAAES